MKCLIIASGPSLTQDDVNLTKGKFDYTIAISDCYRICPWASLLYSCDTKWWKYYNGVPEFTGQKVSPFKACAEKYSMGWIPAQYQEFSFSDSIAFGNSSGYQALNLAVLLGFKEIYLLGYEYQVTDKSHWFGDHPITIAVRSCFDTWLNDMNKAAPQIASYGVRVVNLSRNTAIKCFEKREINELP